jgi:hypothetical protein
MSNHNFYYRDNDFNPGQSAEYTLLVQVGAASLSYLVTGENKLLVLEKDIDLKELTEPSEANKLLSAEYKQRIIGLPQDGFTFIPDSLFKADGIADIARFLDVKATEKVFAQRLDGENIVVYKVDGSIVTQISDKYDLDDAVFGPKCWIRAIAANNPSDETLYLNINKDKVELLNFKSGNLRFFNNFEFKNSDELVYFTTLVAGELQLLPQNITLILSGDVESGDNNNTRLAEFFGKVELNDLNLLELPAEIASHTVLTLTALSLCGSLEAH